MLDSFARNYNIVWERIKDNQPIPPCAFHTMGDDMTMRPIIHDDTVGKTPSEFAKERVFWKMRQLTEFPENYHFTVPDEATERFKHNKAKIKPL